MHKCLVCAYKSQDFAQSQNIFARSHNRENSEIQRLWTCDASSEPNKGHCQVNNLRLYPITRVISNYCYQCPVLSYGLVSCPPFTLLYCTVLYCTVLYCTVLYCTALYCTVMYCNALYCTAVPSIGFTAPHLVQSPIRPFPCPSPCSVSLNRTNELRSRDLSSQEMPGPQNSGSHWP